MTGRDPALQSFVTSLGDALAACDLVPDAVAAINRVFEALALPGGTGSKESQSLPVCDTCLPEALATARRPSSPVARLIAAFEPIAPRLFWARRGASGPHASANWPDGHANATIIGPNGLETRHDVQIGVSLLAPDVRYPDHSHPPEEVYLVLSPGRFRHGETGWFEPGIGGTLYNEPHIRHAMASDAAPLLALWVLWTDRTAARADEA